MAKNPIRLPRPKMQSWRPRPEDQYIMDRLKDKLGIEVQNILRLAIRRLAEQEGIDTKAA